MPESLNNLPLPISRECPDYEALWQALAYTVARIAEKKTLAKKIINSRNDYIYMN